MTNEVMTTEVGKKRDPERTRQHILDVAITEFASRGYFGARIDQISELTHVTKRMIYYYFTSKEGLYRAALAEVFGKVIAAESAYSIEGLSPLEALRKIAAVTCNLHEDAPEWARLVSSENMGEASMIVDTGITAIERPVIGLIERVLDEGRQQGLFRQDVDAIDVHFMISSFCFFRINNRFTYRANFGRDLLDPATRDKHQALIGDMVVAYLTS